MVNHSERHGASQATILVVEDDMSIRDMMTASLRGAGYRVLEAVDGSDALRVVDAHPERIALVLTDILMPHLDGRQLADAVSKQRPATRFLFVSGELEPAMRAHISTAGHAFLAKPYSLRTLLQTVEKSLQNQHSSNSAH